MTTIRLNLDAAYDLVLVSSENEMPTTSHFISKPTEYPALYVKKWWDNPNGPADFEYTEIASGMDIIVCDDD